MIRKMMLRPKLPPRRGKNSKDKDIQKSAEDRKEDAQKEQEDIDQSTKNERDWDTWKQEQKIED